MSRRSGMSRQHCKFESNRLLYLYLFLGVLSNTTLNRSNSTRRSITKVGPSTRSTHRDYAMLWNTVKGKLFTIGFVVRKVPMVRCTMARRSRTVRLRGRIVRTYAILCLMLYNMDNADMLLLCSGRS